MPRTTNPNKVWRKALRILLVPILLPLLIVALLFYIPHRIVVYLLIWALWIPKGKDILFVYSDSPVWQEYMLTKVLPLVKNRAVVMNWSERSKWSSWSFRAHVFHYFGGDREFNPLVIIFRPFRRAVKFRFWGPFKEWKHGDQKAVEDLREKLLLATQ